MKNALHRLPMIAMYFLAIMNFFTSCQEKQIEIEKWDFFELKLTGPSDGNPFKDVHLTALFFNETDTLEVFGFYDGNGSYKVRFMPDETGKWQYLTSSNASELDKQQGSFLCIPPSGNNRGPVSVVNTYHFEYADKTPYYQIGTTSYAWIHQGDSLEEITLKTLVNSPFNKIRMCVFPKDYTYNKNEPENYAFKRDSAGNNDYSHFDPAFWNHLEKRLLQLRELGIEADLILFHPYDRWGYKDMPGNTDEFYLKYLLSRLSAFRHMWWSAANEFDFMELKTMKDWHEYFRLIHEYDPYKRLASIHNGILFYDHSRPWISHASIQSTRYDSAMVWRERYKKPLVYDECRYEGNIVEGWGNLIPEEMTAMFWRGLITCSYTGHGETYQDPGDILWWAKGGSLKGLSPARIELFKKIFESLPFNEYEPLDQYSSGKHGESYIYYFDEEMPSKYVFKLPGHAEYKVEIIDTWNMTIDPPLVKEGPTFEVDLPGKKYMAVKITSLKPVFPVKGVSINAAGPLFHEYIEVELLHPEAKNIRFTLDGSDPTLASATYHDPLRITSNTMLKAKAIDNNRESELLSIEFKPAILYPATQVDNPVQGLAYTYYKGNWQNLPSFSSLEPVKSGTCKYFDFSMVEDEDYFGVVYKGFISIPEDDVYSFYTRSDDGSRLIIDGTIVVDNDGIHGVKRETGQIGLQKGFHSVEVQFFENWYGEFLEIGMHSKKMSWQIIPQSILYH